MNPSGSFLWAVRGDGNVFRLDAETLDVVGAFPVAVGAPSAIVDVVAAAGSLWVLATTSTSSRIIQLDRGGSRVRSFASSKANASALAWDGVRHLYAVGANGVDALDVQASVLTSLSSTAGVAAAVDPGTGRLFATKASGTQLDWRAPPSGSPTTVSLDSGHGNVIDAVPIVAGAGALWVGALASGGASSVVVRYDPAALAPAAVIPESAASAAAFNLTSLAYNPTRARLYAAYRAQGRVDAVDPATNVATLAIAGLSTSGGAPVAIATHGSSLWWGNGATGEVSRVDLGGGTIAVANAPAWPSGGALLRLAFLT